MPDVDVHFRLEAVAPALHVGSPDEVPLTFSVGDLSILLQFDGETHDDSQVVVEAVRPTSETVVKQLIRREEWVAQEAIYKEGGRDSSVEDPEHFRKGLLWLARPPEETLAHSSMIRVELRAAAIRLVQLLRWLLHKTETVQPLAGEQLLWSRTADLWYVAPGRDDPPWGLSGDWDPFELEPAGIELVQGLLEDSEFAEPLARQVLLEAGALIESNPRAACILAVAAAEVGMKQFVARVASPSEAWLINELPSPPLAKMLTDYFQHLLAASETDLEPFSIPKPLRKMLQEGVEYRNNIVHRGVDPPDAERIGELLRAVDEFLYLLDWASGHAWAARFVPAELRPTGGDH